MFCAEAVAIADRGSHSLRRCDIARLAGVAERYVTAARRRLTAERLLIVDEQISRRNGRRPHRVRLGTRVPQCDGWSPLITANMIASLPRLASQYEAGRQWLVLALLTGDHAGHWQTTMSRQTKQQLDKAIKASKMPTLQQRLKWAANRSRAEQGKTRHPQFKKRLNFTSNRQNKAYVILGVENI